MIDRFRQYALFHIVFFLITLPLSAQEHFSFTSNTGNNMTVLIKSSITPTIGGVVLENSDEIGVFTSDGLCVGAAVWANVNVTITVWGDDEQTEVVDGIDALDTLFFRIWDVSTSIEFPATAVGASGIPVYTADGITILESLAVQPTGTIPSYVRQSGSASLSLCKMYDIRGRLLSRFTGWPILPDGSYSRKMLYPSRGNYIVTWESGGRRSKQMITVLR